MILELKMMLLQASFFRSNTSLFARIFGKKESGAKRLLLSTLHEYEHGIPMVQVERDVRYSSVHPRNVMDIYSGKNADPGAPLLLFVHGGMWLRGSKEQQPLSLYKVASQVMSQAYQTLVDPTPSNDESTKSSIDSNVGLALAQNGGVACVMNYRLAGNIEEDETGHPHQVMDVARAIAFLIHRYRSTKQPLRLFVGGHSAGAHLAALALCDAQYLEMAMKEHELEFRDLERFLCGFIGISGVYNLRRLAMSPLAEITIGPAFLSNKKNQDVVLEASPLHALLRAHEAFAKQRVSALPPMVKVPTLLLNAESDFYLGQDTAEFQTALGQFSSLLPVDVELARQSVVISNRNHLSIMSEFGQGLVCQNEVVDDSDRSGWTASLLSQSRGALSMASSYVASHFVESSKTGLLDEATCRVLEFVGLK